MIQGGWDFVSWAYGIAYGGLAVYGLSLWYRIDQEKRTDEAHTTHPGPHEDAS